MDNKDSSANEIAAKMKAIYDRCEHWKSCNDGSWGLALDNAGFNRLEDELKELGYYYRDGEAVKIETAKGW